MKEHLMNGITLIVDRYVYYAMAESAAAGLDLHWCKSSYSQVLIPDLIFFLNMEREVNEIDKQQLSLPPFNDVLGIGNNDSDAGRKEWQRRIQDSLSRLAEVQWKVKIIIQTYIFLIYIYIIYISIILNNFFSS